ncbi:ABC transporter ATP-binding protein [Pseudoclavibacter sp. 8L]|uniref:ABC transporter ATP-binding protein n=1 Tax=Pseudoclavibacter sp. 8L TaxID=2653162 RepID=UPI0012EFB15A|nr:ABC transporter ATP-binding protein [Pseudoclavibacter sp. 8L]VXB07546.1 putative spermidine/putrescine transporter subunit; ATP-binding component of ABC superfamily tranporter [Pseudoclavibacter sp. 8L]
MSFPNARESVTERPTQAPAGVTLTGIRKKFGDFTAVESLDLQVRSGEFFSMLGPSGSGKTTVLRMIAGFERPTEGTIELGGTDVTDVPPFSREVNTVFQDYALFPHMTIAQNVAYGLRVRRASKAERTERVQQALEQVQLAHLADRKPSQLSGGQRQRIALARALILKPRVLLLDEPLGALDKQLREQMQIELKQIQREIGITFIFVTHDQEEALTLSDRIAVFNQGRIEQIGSPVEVYDSPATPFVAGFLGVSNLLEADAARTATGIDGLVSIRPERITLHAIDTVTAPGLHSAVGVVEEVVYTGPSTRFIIRTDADVRLISEMHNTETSTTSRGFSRGSTVRATWHEEHVAVIS